MRRLAFTICFLLSTTLVYADAVPKDWMGTYSINNDGHMASLTINVAKCGGNVNCSPFFVRYTDDQGHAYPAFAAPLDDNGQHMGLTVEFPGNRQVFDLYLFSFDKTRLAGTTVWGGRTFGVEAFKTSSVQSSEAPQSTHAQPAGSGSLTVDGMGTITISKADGSVQTKKIHDCAWTTRTSDGRISKAPCSSIYLAASPLVLPNPPDQVTSTWMDTLDTQSTSVIQSLFSGSQTSYQNYLFNYENPSASNVYKRVSDRMQHIYDLASGVF